MGKIILRNALNIRQYSWSLVTVSSITDSIGHPPIRAFEYNITFSFGNNAVL